MRQFINKENLIKKQDLIPTFFLKFRNLVWIKLEQKKGGNYHLNSPDSQILSQSGFP